MAIRDILSKLSEAQKERLSKDSLFLNKFFGTTVANKYDAEPFDGDRWELGQYMKVKCFFGFYDDGEYGEACPKEWELTYLLDALNDKELEELLNIFKSEVERFGFIKKTRSHNPMRKV